jgi:hypothetical protein
MANGLHRDVVYKGITLEHHEIREINQDFYAVLTYVKMYSYVSLATFEADNNSWLRYYEFNFLANYNNVNQVRTAIKALDEWVTATDE